MLLGALALGRAAGASGEDGVRHVLAWPPTRYQRAELILVRTDDLAGALDVRVQGREVDVVLALPASGVVRLPLPASAQCAVGVDDCAIVIDRAAGEGSVSVVLQSPDTAGAADTLLLTAHDTVLIPPPAACGDRHVVVSAACAPAPEFPESSSFASVVAVTGRALVTVTGGCADRAPLELVLPEVLTLACAGEGADLTGTLVTADAPLLVLSGNVVTTVPVAPGEGLSADLVMDASLTSLGTSTLVVPPLPRSAAFAGAGDVVRLVAREAVTVRVRDDGNGDQVRTLTPGEAWDLDTAAVGGDRTLRVDADGPVSAWHVLKSRARRGLGDAAGVALVPRELFTTRSRFFQPEGYAEANALVVVVDGPGEVLLDGAALGGFVAAPGGELRWCRVALPPAPSGGQLHELSGSAEFGAWLVGMGGYKAHGSMAAVAWPAADVAVRRGTSPDALVEIARSTGTSWRDSAAPPLAFYDVAADVTLRVSRCALDTCLWW